MKCFVRHAATSALASIFAFLLAGDAAALNYQEPPDLTPNLAIPDRIGNLSLGVNTVRGEIGRDCVPFPLPCDPDEDTADSFEYRIPDGLRAVQLRVEITDYSSGNSRARARVRSFSNGTGGFRFDSDTTQNNIIQSASGLRAGLHDLQLRGSSDDGDDIAYDWRVTITVEVDPCGNGVIDAGEQCDGADLGGATCVDQGFAGGTLGCNGNCRFDTTQCDTCGNDVIDAGEDCDGAELGGATCDSQGFDEGALVCDASCGFDTAGCTSCGDGVCNGSEDNAACPEDCPAGDPVPAVNPAGRAALLLSFLAAGLVLVRRRRRP